MAPCSPSIINKTLGRSVEFTSSTTYPDDFLTDYDLMISEIKGKKVVSWPNDCKFPTSSLTLKYYMVYKIVVNNWLPSSHTTSVFKDMAALQFSIGRGITFDLGYIIFSQIETFAWSKATTINLPYLCLLTSLLLKNGVSCEDYEESVMSKPLKISRRIFAPDKVNDLLVKSSTAPQSSIPVADPTSLH